MNANIRTPPSRCPTARTGARYLVIGGNGFLGSHLVEALLSRGEDHIAIFDMRPSPLFARELADGRVRFIPGNITDANAVRQACQDIDAVFHVAAMVNYWSRLDFEYGPLAAVNVLGTANVIDGCLAAGVKRLLYSSSSTVVVNRDILQRPLMNADESLPYAEPPYLCHYIATKVEAEKLLLGANGRADLATAAVRAAGLFGPRDLFLTRQMAANPPAMAGGDNHVDHVYIENVVHALLGLEGSLAAGPQSATAGRAYFITQGEPPPTSAEFDRRFHALAGRLPRSAPASALTAMATVSEALVRVSRGRLTPFLGPLAMLRPPALVLARATYTFSSARATRDFGYQPLYSLAEGIELSYRYWQAARTDSKN